MTNELNNSDNKKTRKTAWTPERRQAQAERARKTKPWQHATGPRTENGKQTSAKNSQKHGHRTHQSQTLKTLLRAQKLFLESLKND